MPSSDESRFWIYSLIYYLGMLFGGRLSCRLGFIYHGFIVHMMLKLLSVKGHGDNEEIESMDLRDSISWVVLVFK